MEGSIGILMYVKLNKCSTFYTYTESTSKIFVSAVRGVSGVRGIDGESGMFLSDLLEFVVEGVAKFNSFGTSPVK